MDLAEVREFTDAGMCDSTCDDGVVADASFSAATLPLYSQSTTL